MTLPPVRNSFFVLLPKWSAPGGYVLGFEGSHSRRPPPTGERHRIEFANATRFAGQARHRRQGRAGLRAPWTKPRPCSGRALQIVARGTEKEDRAAT
jgi:hypothetical protein